MGDLTEDEMATWERFIKPGADNVGRAHEMLLEAFVEIRRHRATVAADKERVRSVVGDAARTVLDELCTWPQPRIAAYAERIADRAAEQIAAPVVQLSANERSTLKWLRSLLLPGQSEPCRDAIALIDRIVGDGR